MPDAWKITPELLGKARHCLRAAELRVEGHTYAAIATEVGAGSPEDAQKACRLAWEMLHRLGGGDGWSFR